MIDQDRITVFRLSNSAADKFRHKVAIARDMDAAPADRARALSQAVSALDDRVPDWHRPDQGECVPDQGTHPDMLHMGEAFLDARHLCLAGNPVAAVLAVDYFERVGLAYLLELDRLAVRQAYHQGAFGALCDRYDPSRIA